MDDRYLVDLSDSQQNAFLQFVSGLHTNSPEERASHLAKQGFHDVQPGAMRGSQHVFESIGASRQKGSGLAEYQHKTDRVIPVVELRRDLVLLAFAPLGNATQYLGG